MHLVLMSYSRSAMDSGRENLAMKMLPKVWSGLRLQSYSHNNPTIVAQNCPFPFFIGCKQLQRGDDPILRAGRLHCHCATIEKVEPFYFCSPISHCEATDLVLLLKRINIKCLNVT